jgi:DnaJ-class molecular chaperone
MPDVKDPAVRGDLFVAVDIQLPTSLSAEAKEHYQALEKLAGTS